MSMNFITLRQIIDDFILTLDGDDYVSTASDVAIRNFALRGIREFGFDVTSKVKSIKRSVQSNDTVTLPDDYVDLVKIGVVDDDGTYRQEIIDVAGGPSDADVDPATCRPRGPGADTLCGVWRDPDFDPARPAVYYARVIENPSCRWSAWQCLAIDAAERPAACSDPSVPKRIQERAWTSPVWYSPG